MERLDEYDPRRGRSGRPWRRITAYVREHGGDNCILCGQWIDKTLPHPHPQSFSVDHITPLSLGGHPTDLANLGPAHLSCNSSKQDRMTVDRADKTSIEW